MAGVQEVREDIRDNGWIDRRVQERVAELMRERLSHAYRVEERPYVNSVTIKVPFKELSY